MLAAAFGLVRVVGPTFARVILGALQRASRPLRTPLSSPIPRAPDARPPNQPDSV